MKLPDYLNRPELTDRPLDYEWSRLIANTFVSFPDEENPRLADAVELISARAAFVLCIACIEWVVARFQKHVDTTDALFRLEAARAAAMDWRYATLPRPPFPNPTTLDPVTEPLIIGLRLLTFAHDALRKNYLGSPNNQVRMNAVNAALLAEHVTPPDAGFGQWLTDSLRKANRHYPARDVPIGEEALVPPDFFDPGFVWSDEAANASRERSLQVLDPSTNPYLRKAEEMHADGFAGDPYRDSR